MTFPINATASLSDTVRPGIKDIWNANMAKGAAFGKFDIPFCPTTATSLPAYIITWEEAKAIYKKQLAKGNKLFRYHAYVCFYLDDHKFDGSSGIWHNCKYALRVLSHFSGAITPDFSTFQDFPCALKIYQTYRMRLFGYWLGTNGISVINNVRWGSSETYSYCFEGIPRHSVVAIGTVGGSPRAIIDRERFESGFFKMLEILAPETIIVYGSANYVCFEEARRRGIIIVSFQSKTARAYERSVQDEQK